MYIIKAMFYLKLCIKANKNVSYIPAKEKQQFPPARQNAVAGLCFLKTDDLTFTAYWTP